MMRNIVLHGFLGKKYGRIHQYDVHSPAEAMSALIANHPKIRFDIIEAEQKGLSYIVRSKSFEFNEETLLHPIGVGSLHIVPVYVGASKSSNGALKIGIGVALTVVGMYFGVGFVGSMGMSLALGGVSMMLTPDVKAQQQNSTNQKNSFYFGGLNSVSRPGSPVPVLYGKFRVPAIPITVELSVIDEQDYQPTLISGEFVWN